MLNKMSIKGRRINSVSLKNPIKTDAVIEWVSVRFRVRVSITITGRIGLGLKMLRVNFRFTVRFSVCVSVRIMFRIGLRLK